MFIGSFEFSFVCFLITFLSSNSCPIVEMAQNATFERFNDATFHDTWLYRQLSTQNKLHELDRTYFLESRCYEDKQGISM